MFKKLKKIFKNNTGKEIAETLDKLGYFKYTVPEEIEALKSEISNAYENHGMLSSIYTIENGKYYPKDFRLYSLDNEALFEKGGYRKYLAEIEPTFKKLHIPLIVDEDREDYSESGGFSHYIIINGVRYTILDNFRNYSKGGVVATRKFIETINKVLERQSSDERAYPISKGVDGQLIFLTRKQFNYISAVYPENENKPKKVRDWTKRYNAT